MEKVATAVNHASDHSKRKGKWANKPEISARIEGEHPANLGKELKKLVDDGAIEKKEKKELWRPQGGLLGAGSKSGRYHRGENTPREEGRETGDRSSKDDRETTKAAVSTGLAAGAASSTTSSIMRSML
jgi:hypothetical protein